MTLFFRPCGALTRAPAPRSSRDDALRARISDALGCDITIDPALDYEDWTEPMTLLDAAIARGLDIAVLPRAPLGEAMDAPLHRLPGTPCPDILLGRLGRMDSFHLPGTDLVWPPRDDARANHYGELAAFHAAAGRDLALADMPGDPDLGLARQMIGDIVPLPPGDALTRFAGGSCLVKQVFPGKSLPLFDLDVPAGADATTCERLLLGELGLHFARFEGEKGTLLLQERVEMTHETRFFVVNGEVVCGAACIEDHTPLENTSGEILSPVFETRRNSGAIVTDPAAAEKLLDAARTITTGIVAEDAELTHFVLDLALDPAGQPLAIELNPIGSSGLYGIAAGRLLDAVLVA